MQSAKRTQDNRLDAAVPRPVVTGWLGVGASLLCAGLLLGGCGLFSASCPTPRSSNPEASPSASQSDRAVGEMQVLQRVSQHVQALTNERRRERGLSPLQRNFGLRELACQHSRDMISRSFFSHENPDGETPQDRAALYHRHLIGQSGENIWKRTTGRPAPVTDAEALARTIVTSWMESPGHRANILRAPFTHLGVCVVQEGNDFRATQSFAEARAFFDDPLPKRMAPSSQRAVSVTPVPSSAQKPVRYDFWDPVDEQRVAGPHPFEDRIRAPETEGRVQIRFHVPQADGFVLAHGPILHVSTEARTGSSGRPSARAGMDSESPPENSEASEMPSGAPEAQEGTGTAPDFRADVIEESHQTPVLVDFWAPGCGYCRELTPVLESLAEEQEAWTLAKVNVDRRSPIAQRYGVRRVPTVKLFVDGTEKAAFTGAKSESDVQAWIGEHLPSASAANSPSTAADTTQNPSPDSTSSGHVGW